VRKRIVISNNGAVVVCSRSNIAEVGRRERRSRQRLKFLDIQHLVG
jgi:hypothetical protein